MRFAFGTAAVAITVGLCMAQTVQAQRTYELYSWQKSVGRWSFCLLVSPSGPNVTPEQVFSRKCLVVGVSNLQQRISMLRAQSTVIWLDRFTGTQQRSGKGGTLSDPLIRDVRHEAESHNIKLEMGCGAQAR